MSTAAFVSSPVPERLTALDAYRGFVMLLMLNEALRLPQVARAFPDSSLWQWIAFHTEHVDWRGVSLHDLIQPGFSFLVGAALPFSLANRGASGQTRAAMWFHAAYRAVALVLLGVLLRSLFRGYINWTFDDTLTQIGFGYLPLFALGLRSVRTQWIALAVILIGYWAAFALYPVAPPHAGSHAYFTGFEAHWNKNTNLAWAFDTWWMNLFPRPKEFLYSGGGYCTLSFIPTLGTMIIGLLAGGWLRTLRTPREKLVRLVIAGAGFFFLSLTIDALGICPYVKRIWTPTWTLYSGGLVLWFTAFFYAIADFHGKRSWVFPLTVIGMNSIFAYLLSWIAKPLLLSAFKSWGLFSGPLALMYEGLLVLAIFWLILYFMQRRRLFVRL